MWIAKLHGGRRRVRTVKGVKDRDRFRKEEIGRRTK
jgi:hypothetical protein